MKYDFNVFEKKAKELMDAGSYSDALRLYFFMADGDSSLDGGYLGERIALCYEKMGELYAAKYWYGRAVEENPEIMLESKKARDRLKSIVSIDDLISPKEYLIP